MIQEAFRNPLFRIGERNLQLIIRIFEKASGLLRAQLLVRAPTRAL